MIWCTQNDSATPEDCYTRELVRSKNKNPVYKNKMNKVTPYVHDGSRITNAGTLTCQS